MSTLAFSFVTGSNPDEAQGLVRMKRAADGGQPKAQAYLRANGFMGPLPPLFDQAGQMIPSARDVSSHARICGDVVS